MYDRVSAVTNCTMALFRGCYRFLCYNTYTKLSRKMGPHSSHSAVRHNTNPVWRATSKRPMIRTNNEHRSWLQLYYPYYILPIPSGTEWAIPFHLDWFPQIQRLLVKHNIVNAAVKEAVCLVFLRQNKIRFWKGSDTLHISSWCNLMISQE